MSIVAGTPSDVTAIHVKCNRHPRAIVPVLMQDGEWFDAREWAHTDLFDRAVDGFYYRGSLYAVEDFERAGDRLKARGFDGVMAESAFSAVVVTYFDREGYELDGQIIVGFIHW